jgi:uncharacterized glyoxalase superfamily protein PhnB
MKIASFYPVLMTSRVKALRDFYCEHFNFSIAFEADWYVSLKKVQQEQVIELALLESGHPTIPAGFGRDAQGVILNFEVENAREEYKRLVQQRGLEELLPLRDEAFGQRHFMITDPAGNIVDIIENIAPDKEFEENYTHAGG